MRGLSPHHQANEFLGDAYGIQIETQRSSSGSDGVHGASCRMRRLQRLFHGSRSWNGNAVLHHQNRHGPQRDQVQGRTKRQRRHAAKLGSEENFQARFHEGSDDARPSTGCRCRRPSTGCNCRRPSTGCNCRRPGASCCRRLSAGSCPSGGSSAGKTAIAFRTYRIGDEEPRLLSWQRGFTRSWDQGPIAGLARAPKNRATGMPNKN